MGTRHFRRAVVVAVAVGAALLAALPVLRVAYQRFADSSLHHEIYCKRGSIAFYVAITSSTIRAFPVPAPIGDPVFTHRVGDGSFREPKPISTGIIYTSTQSKEQIMKILEDHFLTQGFVAQMTFEGEERIYTKDDLRIGVRFYQNSDGQQVIADETHI
jgi:hypothetical protein